MNKNYMNGSTSLLLLSLLAEKDMYGYEMIETLELRSNKVFSLKTGTLYPLLHGLEKDGAVKAWEQTAPTGRNRRYYGITPKGKKLLAEKQQEWSQFAQAVNLVIKGGGNLATAGE